MTALPKSSLQIAKEQQAVRQREEQQRAEKQRERERLQTTLTQQKAKLQQTSQDITTKKNDRSTAQRDLDQKKIILSNAKFDVKRAQSNRDLAEKYVDRWQKLVDESDNVLVELYTKKQLRKAQRDLKNAETALENAQNRVDELENDVEDAKYALRNAEQNEEYAKRSLRNAEDEFNRTQRSYTDLTGEQWNPDAPAPSPVPRKDYTKPQVKSEGVADDDPFEEFFKRFRGFGNKPQDSAGGADSSTGKPTAPSDNGDNNTTDGPLGLKVSPVTPQQISNFGLKTDKGLVIVNFDAHSAAADAGLQLGDVIERVALAEVSSVAQLKFAVGNILGRQESDDKSVALFINRRGDRRYVVVNVRK